MSKLSARQFEIVKKLLNNDIVRIEDISGEFNISNRTVYREINFIKKYLNEQYNVDLSNKKEGMKIVANDSEIERIKMDFWTKKPNISIAERKQYILSELLRANEPLKLDYFARKFNVSAATISYDLKDIEKHFLRMLFSQQKSNQRRVAAIYHNHKRMTIRSIQIVFSEAEDE